MLLGSRRVVSIERGPTGLRAVLRCHCDTLIVWSADSGRTEGAEDDERVQPSPVAAASGDQPPMSMTRTVPSGATSVTVGATKLVR